MTSRILCLLTLFLFPTLAFAAPTIDEAFSPHHGATELVVRTIDQAKTSILVAAYSFTSRPIADALIASCRRGVDVRVVFDKSQRTNNFIARAFGGSCVKRRINYHYSIMHDKFIVADNDTLETGSFNYTQAAEKKNAENVLVIHGAPDVVSTYAKKWQELWEESE